MREKINCTFESVPVFLMSCFSCLNHIFMCDSISLALHFAAKPGLIALCVVGGVAGLAILVAIIAYFVHKNNSNQASFSNGKVS